MYTYLATPTQSTLIRDVSILLFAKTPSNLITGLNTWTASCLMHTVIAGLLERELWTRPGEKTGESSSFIIAQSDQKVGGEYR